MQYLKPGPRGDSFHTNTVHTHPHTQICCFKARGCKKIYRQTDTYNHVKNMNILAVILMKRNLGMKVERERT